MFGLGVFTYLKIGAVILLVAVGSYFYVHYNWMQTKLATQELVIAQQQQTIETYQKFAEIDTDTAKQKEEFHEVLKSGDHQRIIDYFRRMRSLSTDPGKGED